jgi:hypothetical protein
MEQGTIAAGEVWEGRELARLRKWGGMGMRTEEGHRWRRKGSVSGTSYNAPI